MPSAAPARRRDEARRRDTPRAASTSIGESSAVMSATGRPRLSMTTTSTTTRSMDERNVADCCGSVCGFEGCGVGVGCCAAGGCGCSRVVPGPERQRRRRRRRSRSPHRAKRHAGSEITWAPSVVLHQTISLARPDAIVAGHADLDLARHAGGSFGGGRLSNPGGQVLDHFLKRLVEAIEVVREERAAAADVGESLEDLLLGRPLGRCPGR